MSSDKFLQCNQLDALISRIYFWNKTLHVSDSFSVHEEFHTVHTAMVYVTQVCLQAVWYIPLLCVQWETPDDGQRNCPKHVEFYSKNKFEKFVRLVGFIIRIYYDARSPERQIRQVRNSEYLVPGQCCQTVRADSWFLALGLCLQWKQWNQRVRRRKVAGL